MKHFQSFSLIYQVFLLLNQGFLQNLIYHEKKKQVYQKKKTSLTKTLVQAQFSFHKLGFTKVSANSAVGDKPNEHQLF